MVSDAPRRAMPLLCEPAGRAAPKTKPKSKQARRMIPGRSGEVLHYKPCATCSTYAYFPESVIKSGAGLFCRAACEPPPPRAKVRCTGCRDVFEVTERTLHKGGGRTCGKRTCQAVAKNRAAPMVLQTCHCRTRFFVSKPNADRAAEAGRHLSCSVACRNDAANRVVRHHQTCANCQTAFTVTDKIINNGGGRFCSRACRAAGKKLKLPSLGPAHHRTLVPRTCERGECGKPFHATPTDIRLGRGRFCSIACSAERRRTPLRVLTCLGCTATFETHRPREKPYCSRRCAGGATNPPKIRPPVTCIECGKDFMAKRRNGAVKLCSRRCIGEHNSKLRPPAPIAPRSCDWCGTTFTPLANRTRPVRFCTRAHALKHVAATRRRPGRMTEAVAPTGKLTPLAEAA